MRWILCAVLWCCAEARAGQLHIYESGLKEVAAQAETSVIGGRVLAAKKVGRAQELELEVTQVFANGAPNAKPGERVKVTVYPGVEWTDPRKSPIEHRLRGSIGGAKLGDEVVAVPHQGMSRTVELLAPSAALTRKLEILFIAAVREKYPSEPEAKLVEDLRDLDLAEMARAALEKRGKLTVSMLVRSERRFFDDHYRKLSPAARAKFADEAVALVDKDPSLRDQVADVILREPDPGTLRAVARLLAKYDPATEFRRLDNFHTETQSLLWRLQEKRIAGPLDLSPLAEYLIVYEARRPDYKSSDDDLPKMTKHMNGAAKQKLAHGFLENVYTSTHTRPDEPDGFLLDEAARLAEESPSPSLLIPLAKIDPSKPRVTSTKEFVMASMLRIAIAVAKASPSSKQAARDLIEPYLDRGIGAPDEQLDAWRKHVGPTKKMAPRVTILELGPGEMRRLSTGARVRFVKDGSDFALELEDGERSDRYSLPAKEDWKQTLTWEPFTVELKKTPSGRLHLRFTPL